MSSPPQISRRMGLERKQILAICPNGQSSGGSKEVGVMQWRWAGLVYLPGTGHSPKGWYGQAHRGQSGLELRPPGTHTWVPVQSLLARRRCSVSQIPLHCNWKLCFRLHPIVTCDCGNAEREEVHLEWWLYQAGERGWGSGQPWAEAGRVDVWDGSHLARGKTGQLSAGIYPLNLAFWGFEIIGCISTGTACQVSVLDIWKQGRTINISKNNFQDYIMRIWTSTASRKLFQISFGWQYLILEIPTGNTHNVWATFCTTRFVFTLLCILRKSIGYSGTGQGDQYFCGGLALTFHLSTLITLFPLTFHQLILSLDSVWYRSFNFDSKFPPTNFWSMRFCKFKLRTFISGTLSSNVKHALLYFKWLT